MKMKNPNFVRGPNGEGGGEGQGFGHCLVIPKKRIFNVVDPEATANNCSVLKELRDHWKKFWREGGADKILWRTRKAVCDQEIELVAMRDQANEKHKEQYYDSKVTQEVLEDFKEMGKEFRRLGVEDFLYGFHLFPDSTVAHLHMHVFPKHEEYRRFSTHAHDPKTVPLQAILDAESEDQSEAQVEEDETALAQHEEN